MGVPSYEDFRQLSGSEQSTVVACSGLGRRHGIALRVQLKSGTEADLYLDQLGARRLLETLKLLMPSEWQVPIGATPLRRVSLHGVEVEFGPPPVCKAG